jgi:hypothetical protein
MAFAGAVNAVQRLASPATRPREAFFNGLHGLIGLVDQFDIVIGPEASDPFGHAPGDVMTAVCGVA